MDIRQLRYFCAIAEEGQISKAAQRLHIAQPPLSLQLKLLEQELGVQLIERNTRSMHLTKAGHAFYQRAEQILDLLHVAAQEVRDLEHGVHGVLAIGSPPAIGNLYMPERIQAFHMQHPHVRFHWREGNTYRILELLDAQVIEFGIARLPVPTGIYESIPLLTESWVAVTHKNDQKRRHLESIPLVDLAEGPLLLMHRQEGIHCHDMVLDELRSAGMTPNIFCESDNVSALLSLVERGLGIAILPQSALSVRSIKDFHPLFISDCNLQSSSAILWRKGKRLSATARLFLNMF